MDEQISGFLSTKSSALKQNNFINDLYKKEKKNF